ncbi:MAG TPA: GerMN domain-containing protein [Vicinamibacterales bacterium]|mgnify:CR=1 FL=1|nr:GerMN domain-containing protein [Vicinamibacterales bacterium]
MTARRLFAVVAAVAGAAAFGWLVMSALGSLLRAPALPPAEPTTVPTAVVAPPAAAPATGPHIKATLYFASPDGQRLVGVQREVPLADGPVAQARVLVEALLRADAPDALSSIVPAGTSLRGVYVSNRNEVFVDLDSTVRTKHPGGSMQELLTVYGLVNTLLVNLPTMTEVQILVEGREADTLAGHVDLRRPLRKNDALIVSADPTPQDPS